MSMSETYKLSNEVYEELLHLLNNTESQTFVGWKIKSLVFNLPKPVKASAIKNTIELFDSEDFCIGSVALTKEGQIFCTATLTEKDDNFLTEILRKNLERSEPFEMLRHLLLDLEAYIKWRYRLETSKTIVVALADAAFE